jgi:hypothetical protein
MEDGINRSDALSDPAHDRDRHRIAESFVAWAVGCQPATILDQGVISRGVSRRTAMPCCATVVELFSMLPGALVRTLPAVSVDEAVLVVPSLP